MALLIADIASFVLASEVGWMPDLPQRTIAKTIWRVIQLLMISFFSINVFFLKAGQKASDPDLCLLPQDIGQGFFLSLTHFNNTNMSRDTRTLLLNKLCRHICLMLQ